MKKIKYVMPILGLGAIAGSLVPIVSCGKVEKEFDGIVTATEWKDSIRFLLCQTDEIPRWSSSDTDTVVQKTIDGDDTYVDSMKNILYDYGDYKAVVNSYKNDKKIESITQYSQVVGNFNYNADIDNETKLMSRISIDYLYTDKAIDSIFTLLVTLADYKDVFTFEEKDKLYSYMGEIIRNKFIYDMSTWVGFNKDKHISYFETLLSKKNVEDEKEVSVVYIKLHFNYGKPAIDYPMEFNTRVNAHYHPAETGSVNVNSLISGQLDEGHIINFIVPEDGAQYMNVTFNKAPAAILDPSKMYIIHNKKLLTGYDTDYSVINNSQIKILRELKKGDVINFWFKPNNTVVYENIYNFAFAK